MKFKSCIVAMLLLCTYSRLQGQTDSQPLKPGDAVPSVRMKMMNSPRITTAAINNYRGKLLILDFWASTCSACIQLLPRLDALQRQFGPAIQVIAVTYEDNATAARMLQNNKWLKGLALPVVYDDTVLSRLFPYTYLPHDVWIDEKGIVQAITTSEYITQENIEAMLRHQQVSWPVKNDDLSFDISKPLANTVNGMKPRFYASIAPHLQGVPPTAFFKTDTVTGTQRLSLVNLSIPHLYAYALQEGLSLIPKRSLLQVADTTLYRLNGYRDVWEQQHTWCYEAILPAALNEREVFRAMKADLDRFFRLYGRIEERPVTCWVITRPDSITHLPLSRYADKDIMLDDTASHPWLHAATIGDLVYMLNENSALPWLEDATACPYPLDMEFNSYVFRDYHSFRKALNQYGFDVKPETKVLPMFVLSENSRE